MNQSGFKLQPLKMRKERFLTIASVVEKKFEYTNGKNSQQCRLPPMTTGPCIHESVACHRPKTSRVNNPKSTRGSVGAELVQELR